MNEYQPSSYDQFYLADEYILDVLRDVAEPLILHGAVTANTEGERYKKEDDPTPHVFSYTVPSRVVKDLFFENDDLVVHEGKLSYTEPHRIDDDPRYDGQTSSVVLVLEAEIPEVDVEVTYCYYIGHDDNRTQKSLAEIDVEYGQDERVVGYEDLKPDHNYAENDSRRYSAMLESYKQRSRPMTLDDIEKMHVLAEYVKTHPQRGE